jgi:hypothetical protein
MRFLHALCSDINNFCSGITGKSLCAVAGCLADLQKLACLLSHHDSLKICDVTKFAISDVTFLALPEDNFFMNATLPKCFAYFKRSLQNV